MIAGAGIDELQGGTGNDFLTGGGGSDLFTFLGPGQGTDLIFDFLPSTDRIQLSREGFGFAALALGFNLFINATPAATANAPTFLFDTDAATRTLFFDIDGIGSATAEAIIQFTPGTVISAGDLFLL